MKVGTMDFKHVWAVDFEFGAEGSELPDVRCLVAHDLATRQKLRLWEGEIKALNRAPYDLGNDSLFVAYFSSAELLCHQTLGWEQPQNVLDLFVEFRVMTNGKELPCGNGILGAQAFLGLDAIDSSEKDSMRTLALRGGTYTNEEKQQLLDYCETDVVALEKLLGVMGPRIDIERALVRGQYMGSVALMEFHGISLDTENLVRLKTHWERLKEELVKEIDPEYGVYDGLTFKVDRFADYLIRHKMSWPRHVSGTLDLRDDTFKDMARTYPQLEKLRELRRTLSQLRLKELTVGPDGHSRTLISPFRSKTGRNQPSSSKFIFSMPSYMRHLITPRVGRTYVYLDYSQQEFGIAAALSNDEAMLEAYLSGDPYLAFAKLAGAAPSDATKKSHADVREQYKACVLAVQYGMGSESLALRIQKPEIYARILLQKHKSVFKKFWDYSDAVVNFAALHGYLVTTYGWRIEVGSGMNERSIRNFPMQANGAEILRLACILCAKRGVRICAPVHDAILIEAPSEDVQSHIAIAQTAMADASELVLRNLRLRSDSKIIRHPERYTPERGQGMWESMMKLLDRIEAHSSCANAIQAMCLIGTFHVLLSHIRSISFMSV